MNPFTILNCFFLQLHQFFWKGIKSNRQGNPSNRPGLNPGNIQCLIPYLELVRFIPLVFLLNSVPSRLSRMQTLLLRYCGIVWNDNDSGDFEAEDKRMSKAGNRYLRYYIIEAAGSVINHCLSIKPSMKKICWKQEPISINEHSRWLPVNLYVCSLVCWTRANSTLRKRVGNPYRMHFLLCETRYRSQVY